MKHIRRISGLVALALLLGACSSLGLGGLGGGDKPSAQSGGDTSMVQEIMDLEAALASERARADKAEDIARRANEEVAWLAEAAQGVPEMQARLSGLEERIEVLQRHNVDSTRMITELSNEVVRLEQAAEEREAREAMARERELREAEALEQGNAESQTTAPNPPDSSAETLSGNMADETGVYGLHIASYRSREELVRGWTYLRAAHAEILGGLSAKSLLFDVPTLGGTYFRLIVGPVVGGRNAQELCDALSGRGEYCVVAEFDGGGEDVE